MPGPISQEEADKFSQGLNNSPQWSNLSGVVPWLKGLVQGQPVQDNNQQVSPDSMPQLDQQSIDALKSAAAQRAMMNK